MRKLHILNDEGHATLVVDGEAEGRERVVSADEARAEFDRLVAGGHLAYKTGERAEVIREYDPEAREIIVAPRMQGGC